MTERSSRLDGAFCFRGPLPIGGVGASYGRLEGGGLTEQADQSKLDAPSTLGAPLSAGTKCGEGVAQLPDRWRRESRFAVLGFKIIKVMQRKDWSQAVTSATLEPGSLHSTPRVFLGRSLFFRARARTVVLSIAYRLSTGRISRTPAALSASDVGAKLVWYVCTVGNTPMCLIRCQ